MKKKITIVLVVLMILCCLAGCRDNRTPSGTVSPSPTGGTNTVSPSPTGTNTGEPTGSPTDSVMPELVPSDTNKQ